MNDWAGRGNPTTHRADMRATGLPDSTFDEVFACNVLEHVPDTRGALGEWARILKPGGRLTVIVPDCIGIIEDFRTGRNTWAECSERLCGSQTYREDVHRAAFTLGQVRPHMEAVGLSVLEERSSHGGGGVYCEAVKDGESKTGTG